MFFVIFLDSKMPFFYMICFLSVRLTSINLFYFQIVKSGVLPRVPDCFQRSPKRVALQNQPGDEVLAMTVDGQVRKVFTINGGR